MTSPRENPQDEPDIGPLGSAVSPPGRVRPGEDGVLPDAEGMAGPVYPPPETEPDAAED
jgi:hypothetical protein